MKILLVNPIPYTSETPQIRRAPSIKDTMIHDLALAFCDAGHDTTLFLAEPFKPAAEETFPFRVVWAPCKWPRLFRPHVIPYCPSLAALVEKERFDLVIASEIFQMNTLLLARRCKHNLLVWQELAAHNRMLFRLPSLFWHNVVARLFLSRVPVVARSVPARAFVSRYCKNTRDTVVGHGVNLAKFEASREKEPYFVVCSQLIERKRVDKIVEKFHAFARNRPGWTLRIFGEGDCEAALKAQVEALGDRDKILFFGKAPHERLKDELKKASAMLVYTRKDLNMVSIAESVACGTPVITTPVPTTAALIRDHELGIVRDDWDERDLDELADRNALYVANCLSFRPRLSTAATAERLLSCARR